jgi:hypothetical protein
MNLGDSSYGDAAKSVRRFCQPCNGRLVIRVHTVAGQQPAGATRNSDRRKNRAPSASARGPIRYGGIANVWPGNSGAAALPPDTKIIEAQGDFVARRLIANFAPHSTAPFDGALVEGALWGRWRATGPADNPVHVSRGKLSAQRVNAEARSIAPTMGFVVDYP